MAFLLLATSLSLAQAQTFITDIGEPIISAEEFGCHPSSGCNPVSGGWPRTIWYEDTTGECLPLPERTAYQRAHNLDTECTGWKLLYAQGGNYKMIHVPDPIRVEDVKDFQYHEIAPSGELRDHAFRRCPSGNYLHTASANLDAPNDSAYAFRYDKDLQPLSDGPIEEREGSRDHNDMPLACSPLGHITAFGGSAPDDPEQVDIHVYSRFFWLGEGGTTVRTKDTIDVPRTGGCTFHWEPESQQLLILEMDRTEDLVVTRLDPDLNVRSIQTVRVLPDYHRGGWPQGLIRIGDYYMVAFVNQETPEQFVGLVGEIWVAVFDMEWNLLEAQTATDFDPLVGGAMTPFLTRHEDQVLLTYDWNVHPGMNVITVDLEAFGVEVGDTGGYWDTGTLFDDTGEPGPEDSDSPIDTEVDTDTPADSDTPVGPIQGVEPVKVKGCGCAATAQTGHGLAWVALAGMMMLRRRRAGS